MSTKNRKKLRGTVLFTTLTVMMVMVLLILTTIALAGAASQKAYSNWFDNQTNYTAQSLVDNIVTSLANGENAELGSDIINAIEGGVGKSVTVDVTENGDTNIPGYGRVESITFTNVGNNSSEAGDNNYYLKENAVTLRDKMIVKITAEISMSGGRERSTYTKYVIGSSQKTTNPSPSGPGGLNALSSFESGSGNDSIWTYGKAYGGIIDPLKEFGATNDQRFGGDVYFNMESGKTFTVNAQAKRNYVFGRNDPYNNSYSGLRVDGDFEFGGSGFLRVVSMYGAKYKTGIVPDINLKDDDYEAATIPYGDSFNNIPYLYVQNELRYQVDNDAMRVFGGALNVFCNNMSITSNRGTEGISGNINLVCLGNVTGASNDNVIKAGNNSNLVKWVAKTVNPSSSAEEELSSVNTGNIYCNGNLRVLAGPKLVVPGNLYVSGTLTCDADVEVQGLVYYGSKAGGSNVNKPVATGDELSTITAAYNEAITVKKSINGSSSSDIEMFQTLENVTSNFNPRREADGTHVDGERDSSKQGITDTTSTEEYRFQDAVYNSKSGSGVFDDATIVLKGNSFVFDKATMDCMGNRTLIFIQPADSKTINIDFTKDFTTIEKDCKLIIDDTYGAEIYINGKGQRNKFELNKGRIISLAYCKLLDSATYNNLLALSTSEAAITPIDDTLYAGIEADANGYSHLQTYYDNPHPLIPKIKIYAAPGDDFTFGINNDGAFVTADLIMPDAVLKSDASGFKHNIKYTNMSSCGESKDDFDIYDPSADIKVIGSIALTKVDVDNIMAYYYVDESKKNGTPPGGTGKAYAWADVDGYSNF